MHFIVSNTQHPTFKKIFFYVMRRNHTEDMTVDFVMQDKDFYEILRFYIYFLDI